MPVNVSPLSSHTSSRARRAGARDQDEDQRDDELVEVASARTKDYVVQARSPPRPSRWFPAQLRCRILETEPQASDANLLHDRVPGIVLPVYQDPTYLRRNADGTRGEIMRLARMPTAQ